MKHTDIKEIFDSPKFGEEVTVCGWVRTSRDSKNVAFIELNDGTFFKNLQVVCDDTLANFAEIVKITTGSGTKYYLASVVGILVFLVVAIISLVVYNLLPSVKNEEDFQ